MPLEAVQVTQKIKLNRARAQAGLSQQELADEAQLSKRVVARAEAGLPIRQLSAWAILNALNRVRDQKKLVALEYEQMEWRVEGEL